jgi:hypothetical protein
MGSMKVGSEFRMAAQQTRWDTGKFDPYLLVVCQQGEGCASRHMAMAATRVFFATWSFTGGVLAIHIGGIVALVQVLGKGLQRGMAVPSIHCPTSSPTAFVEDSQRQRHKPPETLATKS